MKRILIFSECHFHLTAINHIFYSRNLYDVELHVLNFVKRIGRSTITPEVNLIIFFLDNSNFLKCSELFLQIFKKNPSIKVLCICKENMFNIFLNVAGSNSYWVDIHSAISVIIDSSEKLFFEDVNENHQIKDGIRVNEIEIEVVKMLSLGLPLSVIAALKGQSLKTTSSHKCSFFKKIGLKNCASNICKFT